MTKNAVLATMIASIAAERFYSIKQEQPEIYVRDNNFSIETYWGKDFDDLKHINYEAWVMLIMVKVRKLLIDKRLISIYYCPVNGNLDVTGHLADDKELTDNFEPYELEIGDNKEMFQGFYLLKD